MRISSSQIFAIANRGMSDINEALNRTQQQISSGKRVLTPADDPVAATKILQLSEELANTKQYGANIDAANNNLTLEESSLKGVTDLIQRMQEITISAGNTATLTKAEYSAFASEVDARINELLNLTNTRNANGDYIFGGFKSREQPFTGDSLSGFRYHGDEGQQFIKVANNTLVAATDSGKATFMDVPSAANTINTYTSPSNLSNPPVTVSVGRVYDQALYDDFYPEDIVFSFNADGNILPHGKNFTATEKSTGRIIVENQPYVPGAEIKLKGVAVKISGNPVSGLAPVAATRQFGSEGPIGSVDFTLAPENFRVRVGGVTQTFVLDSNIASTADLAATLNNPLNGNAARLASLGLRVDMQGFHMDQGINFSLLSGSPNIDSVMGLPVSAGSASVDGVPAKAGDRVFVDSSSKQDIITTLARFSETIKAYNGGPDDKKTVADMVANTLKNLNHAQTSVLNIVSKIGARINTLDSTKDMHLDAQVVGEKVLSDISSLDYAEASTRLSEQSMILQATQQTFIRVSQLTLFSKL